MLDVGIVPSMSTDSQSSASGSVPHLLSPATAPLPPPAAADQLSPPSADVTAVASSYTAGQHRRLRTAAAAASAFTLLFSRQASRYSKRWPNAIRARTAVTSTSPGIFHLTQMVFEAVRTKSSSAAF